jgi:pimeloyl-ACP methyl ester carboxylesterase
MLRGIPSFAETPLVFRLALAILVLASGCAAALDRLATIDTRPGVSVEYWRMERSGAAATLILIPGGGGNLGINMKRDGVPMSDNFLTRSRELFAAAGFNVVVMGKPSDKAGLDAEFRAGPEHLEDLRILVDRVGKEFGKPVWLVATSRGTISAAAAASALPPPSIAGVVLTSSVTNGNNTVPVPSLALQEIRVPVLVMHHKQDQCRICDPQRAGRIVERLKNAPVKRLMLVEGGGGAHGDPCEAMHWHGYIGMEKEAVAAITDFIRNPAPEKP